MKIRDNKKLLFLILFLSILFFLMHQTTYAVVAGDSGGNGQPTSSLPNQLQNGVQQAADAIVRTCQNAGGIVQNGQCVIPTAATAPNTNAPVSQTRPTAAAYQNGGSTGGVGADSGIRYETRNAVYKTTNTIPGLTITKTSTDPKCTDDATQFCIKNGDSAHYTITINYSGALDVTISDSIASDQGTITAASAGSASTNFSANSAQWRLKDFGTGPTYTFTITVLPKSNDSVITNVAKATAQGNSSFAGGNGCPDQAAITANQVEGQCKYLKPNIDIFDTSMGSPNNIGAAVDAYTNAYYRTYVAGKTFYGDSQPATEQAFRDRATKIIQVSSQNGLNPALFLGYWQSESLFSTYPGGKQDFGCGGSSLTGFDAQLQCALGINTPNYISNCATSRNAQSDACKALLYGRTHTDPNFHAIADQNHPITYPVTTFDDFAEAYGPYDDTRPTGTRHENCNHTYNVLLQTAETLNACVATPTTSPQNTTNGNIAACMFYRNDQQPQATTFKSPMLMQMITDVANDPRVNLPPALLAGLVRIESTVPQQYSATGKSYSISDYTDADIQAMTANAASVSRQTIDNTIDSNKAFCPRSGYGALGLTQVEPPRQVHDQIVGLRNVNDPPTVGSFDAVGAYKDYAVAKGASFLGKTPDQLTLQDFCDPKKSLYLGAGFIVALKSGQWVAPADQTAYRQYVDDLAYHYYGSRADNYGSDLWKSLNSCTK